MPEKIIRDPVHDVISFQTDHPLERLLLRLISTPHVQRLRRIRQLGMAHMAYPGADHSRYSHSIGVLQTAREMLRRLQATSGVTAEDAPCLCAALLHDIGHGPFSHVFERVSGVHHEQVTANIVLDPQSEVNTLLRGFDAQLPQQVVDLLNARPSRQWRSDVISSQLDADRFDYLLRDNLMTGARYGDFDLMWLIQHMVVHPTTQRLAILWKGLSAVEAYVQSRYHMYRNVYFHKVVRSAEGMLKLALQRARRLAVQGRLAWPPRDHPVHKAMLGQGLSGEEFTDFDDISVMQCFKAWSRGEDPVLLRLCRGLLFRHIYKTVDISHIEANDDAQRALDTAREAIAQGGADAEGYDLFYDEVEDTPYHMAADARGEGREILIQQHDGSLVEFGQISPMPEVLSRQVMYRRIHVREPYVNAVRRALDF